MDFGSKIKALRYQKQWTQPQLADAMGIEQSYLSKLENGKSIPSADIFSLLLNVFELPTETLLADVDPPFIRDKLSHIPEVAHLLIRNQSRTFYRTKRWLLTSAALCIVGISLGCASYFALIFPENLHAYRSLGVVQEGESKEVFRKYLIKISGSFDEVISQKIRELENRLDEDFLVTSQYRGPAFNIPTEGGSRTYHLEETRSVNRAENHYLLLLAVLLLTSGLFGFILERRLAGTSKLLTRHSNVPG